MAKVTQASLHEDKEFLEFIKNEYGYETIEDVPSFEMNALMYKYKARIDDLDEQDFTDFASINDEEKLKDIAAVYYPEKDFKEMKTEDVIFVQSVAKELDNNPELSLDKIATSKQSVKQSDNPETEQNTAISEIGLEDVKENSLQAEDEGLRSRSLNSDSNEFILDRVKLEVLHESQVIDDQTFQKGIASPEAAVDVLEVTADFDEQQANDYAEGVAEKMLNNPELFAIMPPRFAANLYEKRQLHVAAELQKNPQADVSKENSDIAKLEEYMDSRSKELADETGYYFGDYTNVGDTYNGYMEMFAAREKYMANDAKAPQLKQDIAKNREVLNAMINEYDQEWNIQNISANDEARMSQRFDELEKALPAVELDDNAMKLVSNFKFLDAEGKIEPQFAAPDGSLSDVWQEGYKVAPDSKLAKAILMTKENYMLQDLTATTKIEPQTLQKEISERLPETLFALHVADKTVQGALENPKEYTDKKFLVKFVTELGNIEKPLKISDVGYNAGLDSLVDQAAAAVDRMADPKKLGRSSGVVTKALNPISKIDHRANDRTLNDTKKSKREIRIELLKRTAKSGLSAFLVSGAITAVGAATAADASLTAATMGMNKVAGAVIGTTLAATMLTRNIIRWRKMRKENGQKAGLLSMIKEPRLMSTMATTAMGAAALGFAMSGNPGVAAGLGYGAMALGVGTGIVLNAKDAVKSGLGGWEAAGWAALQTAVTVGAGFAGRATANAAIDFYNKQNPDNDLFQHKEKIGSHMEKTGTETVIDYPKLEQNAEKFLENNWYKDHPDLLQSRIEALQAAGVPNPHHVLLAAHDSGMLAPDNMAMYDGSTSNGQHTVFTKTWAEQANVSFDDVQTMRHLFNNDGSVNLDAAQAYKHLAPHIGEDNFITRMDPRPVIRELYNDRESTYDHSGKMPTKEIDTFKKVDDYGMVRNESDLGLGMVGIMSKPVKAFKKLKNRIGSLMDKIVHKEKPKPEPIIPKPEPRPEPKPEPRPEPKPEPKPEQIPNDKLLLDEYKIVYGIEPNMSEGKDQVWKDYCKRVEEERKISAPQMTTNEFLLARRKNLDEAILNTAVSQNDVNASGKPIRTDYMAKQAKDNRGQAGVVMEARQSLMQSNLTKENYNNKITLSHFTKYMTHFIKKDNVVADGSRDIALNPQMKKNGKQMVLTDLNQYLVDGKPLSSETVQYKAAAKDAQINMAELKKNAERKSSRE